MLKSLIRPTTNRLLDILYPPLCIACRGNVHENGNICAKCWGDISFISDPQCNICGFPFDFEISKGTICPGCMQNEPSFSKSRSVFLYDEASRGMITSFKYNDIIENRAAYARWMARVGADMLNEADLIIPVPLHFSKLVLRKYNQAALLAHELAKIVHKQVLVSAITRKKYTKPQAGFSRKARFKNISGAFKVNPKYISILKDKKILLIDDVMTTGATAEECTKTLLKEKVARVEVLTLAKTIYK